MAAEHNFDDWRLSDDERQGSFEIVALNSLPDVPQDLEVPPGDWMSIAKVSVEFIAAGGNPLDVYAVNAFARNRLSQENDRFELYRLFTDEIVCGHDDNGFTNGRHRVHAMRLAGVERYVIYTKSGKRTPYE